MSWTTRILIKMRWRAAAVLSVSTVVLYALKRSIKFNRFTVTYSRTVWRRPMQPSIAKVAIWNLGMCRSFGSINGCTRRPTDPIDVNLVLKHLKGSVFKKRTCGLDPALFLIHLGPVNVSITLNAITTGTDLMHATNAPRDSTRKVIFRRTANCTRVSRIKSATFALVIFLTSPI